MPQNRLSLTVLKQALKNASKEELINDIADLFKRFEMVQDYYQVKLSATEAPEVGAKYRKIIENEFFPARGFGKARLSVAKKAIADYRKISKTAAGVADIMIFYVEQGVKFTCAYGDIDEAFYNSMASMYEQAVKWILKHQLQSLFEARCAKIVADTSGIGWGFPDDLEEIYATAFHP